MENNIDIKALWVKQVVPVANPSEMIKEIEHFRRKRMRRTIFLNAILLLTILFVVFIWMYFQPQLASTKIGIILTILSIAMAIFFNSRMLPLYKKTNECSSNSDYLNSLLTVKSKENIMQTTVMNVYFILLSAGIGLYMYEYTFGVSIRFGIIAYLAILVWIGFNWFFLRPRIIKKNIQKTDYLINQIEKVQSQLNNSNE